MITTRSSTAQDKILAFPTALSVLIALSPALANAKFTLEARLYPNGPLQLVHLSSKTTVLGENKLSKK